MSSTHQSCIGVSGLLSCRENHGTGAGPMNRGTHNSQ